MFAPLIQFISGCDRGDQVVIPNFLVLLVVFQRILFTLQDIVEVFVRCNAFHDLILLGWFWLSIIDALLSLCLEGIELVQEIDVAVEVLRFDSAYQLFNVLIG